MAFGLASMQLGWMKHILLGYVTDLCHKSHQGELCKTMNLERNTPYCRLHHGDVTLPSVTLILIKMTTLCLREEAVLLRSTA